MDMFTNMNQYLKTLKVEQHWSTKDSSKIHLTSEAEMRQSLIQALSPPQKEINYDELRMKIDKIKSKLRGGGRLTPDERQFLYEYAPDLLKKICEIERERDAFAQRLRACKSQQEMEITMNTRLASAAAGNPVDPDMASVLAGQLSAAMQDAGNKHCKPWTDPTQTEHDLSGKFVQKNEEISSEENIVHTHYVNRA